MSKERLEEIKSRVWKDKGTYAMGDENQREGYIYTLSDYDYEWLIEQAERVQELEEENKRIRQMKYHEAYEQGKFDTNMKVWYEMPKLEKQNKCYRETIEFAINHLSLVKEIGQVDMVINQIMDILKGEE